jgi:NAD(P)-dependent dehydrogenase (short-subunit alcohol dehydrogenase family)
MAAEISGRGPKRNRAVLNAGADPRSRGNIARSISVSERAMKIDLSGKRAVVTGGSRGIGRAIALAFAQTGAAVSVCARGAEALERVRGEIAERGVKAHAARCDLADAAAVQRYIEEAGEALGGIDILVNNASGFGTSHDEAGWAASIDVDLLGTVRAIRAAMPFLERSGAGAIINISSISGLVASARTPPYGAVKAAIIEYTQTEASLLAKKGIRVNCIAPGSIEFPGGSWERRKTDNPQLYNAILRSIPFGRLGRPEEVAQVAAFLASPLAGWVTGQTISVDGGQLLR